jgi:hypothetical protein
MLDFSSVCLLFGGVVGSAVVGIGSVVIACSWVAHRGDSTGE